MKKILFSMFLIFICNIVHADVEVVNNINDEITINILTVVQTIDTLPTKGKNENEDGHDKMLSFFTNLENNKTTFSNILKECMKYYNGDSCSDFIKAYVNYIDGTLNDCSEASNKIGTSIVCVGGFSLDFSTFKQAVSSCAAYGAGRLYYNGNNKEVAETQAYSAGSIYGVCERFIDSLKKCTGYLENYYFEQSRVQLDKREKIRYDCLYELVHTGQIELPTSIMENKCK